MKNQLPSTLSRKVVIHFHGLERTTAGKHPVEPGTQRGKFKEHCVEGTIARVDSLVSAKHDHRVSERVKDRLGAFALVDDLIDARAERGHICERQHDAADPALTFCVRGYPDNEPPVPVAKIDPCLYSTCEDLAVSLLQTGQARQHRDIARRPTSVRRREAKRIRRRLVEARDREVALQCDDRNFNGVEDVDQIRRTRACGRLVTFQWSETSPAVRERDRLSSHFSGGPGSGVELAAPPEDRISHRREKLAQCQQ